LNWKLRNSGISGSASQPGLARIDLISELYKIGALFAAYISAPAMKI